MLFPFWRHIFSVASYIKPLFLTKNITVFGWVLGPQGDVFCIPNSTEKMILEYTPDILKPSDSIWKTHVEQVTIHYVQFIEFCTICGCSVPCWLENWVRGSTFPMAIFNCHGRLSWRQTHWVPVRMHDQCQEQVPLFIMRWHLNVAAVQQSQASPKLGSCYGASLKRRYSKFALAENGCFFVVDFLRILFGIWGQGCLLFVFREWFFFCNSHQISKCLVSSCT